MIQEIINQNIWWQDRELIRRDPKIADLEGQKFRWRPRVLDEFDLTGAPALYTLRGPRQVGKTTALKILIRDLLRDPATAKEQAMYYTCDNIDTHQQLAELVETYLDHVARLNLSGRTLYLFLDEITSVPDWQRGMKHLADLGRLQNTVVILTGSSARDLRQGAERLPGRRGAIANPDKIMLPMDFSEFVGLVDPELAGRCSLQAATPGDSGKSRAEGISTLCDASCFSVLLALLPHRKPLTMLFDQYLLTGGYITAVNAFFRGGHIPFHL
jgi:predicted AAA+ superfamily ATPase